MTRTHAPAEELIKSLATKAQRLPSLSPSRADSEEEGHLVEVERSSAPARINRAAPSHQAPSLAPLQVRRPPAVRVVWAAASAAARKQLRRISGQGNRG